MTAAATSTIILDVAEQLVETHGFAAASVRRVITEADVNLAAVRCRFGSKEALIGAMSHTLCERGSPEVFRDGHREPDDPEEVVTRLVTVVRGGLKAPSSDTVRSFRRGRTP